MIIIFYTKFKGIFGEAYLVGDENGISELYFCNCKWNHKFRIHSNWVYDEEFFKDVKKQVNEYFDGVRYKFDVNINPSGNEIQLDVWNEVCKIPYGQFRTFEDIALSIRKPERVSEVVLAVYNNPIPLLIPSHRVYYSSYDEFDFKRNLFANERFMNYEMAWNIPVI